VTSSIQKRWLLLGGLVDVLALVLMAYLTFEARQNAVSVAAAHLKTITNYAALTLERDVIATHQFLETLSRLPEFAPAVAKIEPTRCSALFTQILQKHPRFINLLYIEPNGDVLCHGLKSVGRINFADRDFVQNTLRLGESTVGSAIFGHIAGQPILPVAYPLKNEAGQVRGVFTATLDLALLTQALSFAQLPRGFAFIMWNRYGLILTRYPKPEQWVGKWSPVLPLIGNLQVYKSGTTFEAKGLDGIHRVWAIAPLPQSREAGLWISAGVPTAELYAAAHRVFIRGLGLLGLATLAMLVAAWLIGRWSKMVYRSANRGLEAGHGAWARVITVRAWGRRIRPGSSANSHATSMPWQAPCSAPAGRHSRLLHPKLLRNSRSP
jgi:hypothetical protein